MKELFGFDLTFNLSASMITSFIIFALLFIFFIVMGIVFDKKLKRNDKLPLKGASFLCILLVDTINKFSDTNFGKENRKIYAPYLLGIASYLSLANISSVIGLTPVYANLGIALSLSIFAFVIFQFTGLKFQGIKERVKGWIGPVPAISFLVFPISIIGEFTTPFAMGMRMFGNIFSGVVLAGLVFAACDMLGAIIGSFAATLAIAAILHPIFDIFFGLLQMYVYFMLTTMFVKQNM